MSIQHPTFTRVLRLRLKDKHARALRERAYWVNQVWNYCNDLSVKVLRREGRILSGFDLQRYTNGCTKEGIPLHSQTVQTIAEALGIDLGLKTAATASNGAQLTAKHYHRLEEQLAVAQRARKKDRARAIGAKIRNQRKDALHKFTTALVNDYGAIFIGNVSTASQTASGNGKSVLDAGWGLLKTQLQYKGERAGRWVEVVNEAYTTQTCSACGARTGPKGQDGLAIRAWECPCGAAHDRDVNAAINIAMAGLVGVEDRVTAARLLREAKAAKAQERKTKLAANKAAKAAAAGHGRPVEGSLAS